MRVHVSKLIYSCVLFLTGFLCRVELYAICFGFFRSDLLVLSLGGGGGRERERGGGGGLGGQGYMYTFFLRSRFHHAGVGQFCISV